MVRIPSYDGRGLNNLMSEIERHLTGSATGPGLESDLTLPVSSTYVLVLFDGLGTAQLDHPAGGPFRSTLHGELDAPFPTTTSVSLATVATAEPPASHGQIAHLSWYPDIGEVVNTLKWVTPGGQTVSYDYPSVLPRPNLWERLRSAGVEPITVQPGDFSASPLTRVLYRGCRFEPAWDVEDLVDATLDLAATERRFIFTYIPFVDFAGHVYGESSQEFTDAMSLSARLWERLVSGLPPKTLLTATADHGLMGVRDDDKILVRDPKFNELRFSGDGRGVMTSGDRSLIEELASETGGELIAPESHLGPSLSEKTTSHLGDALLMAPPGSVILPRGFDKRLVAYHGGLSDEEVSIPLLVV